MEEVRQWLRVLDADPAAQHHDLPELARFMLPNGLRLGEALGVTWTDLDLGVGAGAFFDYEEDFPLSTCNQPPLPNDDDD